MKLTKTQEYITEIYCFKNDIPMISYYVHEEEFPLKKTDYRAMQEQLVAEWMVKQWLHLKK